MPDPDRRPDLIYSAQGTSDDNEAAASKDWRRFVRRGPLVLLVAAATFTVLYYVNKLTEPDESLWQGRNWSRWGDRPRTAFGGRGRDRRRRAGLSARRRRRRR
jgi:hypothetical protein